MNKFKEKFDNIYEHILEARKEAQKRYIEANTIFINKEIAYANNLFIKDNDIIAEYPPMIFGMKVFYDNNLPNNANFILTKTPKNKMEQINELEEELGIDLITLFKAINSKSIWGKTHEIIEHIEDEYNERVWRLQDGHLYMYWEDGSHCCLEISDYGRTWSLRKEDLEDE